MMGGTLGGIGIRSWLLLPPGAVRSCGFLRFERSCEFPGLTPGLRPTVVESEGDGVAGPGVTLGVPGASLSSVGFEPGVVPGVPGAVGDAPDEGELGLPPGVCADATLVRRTRARIVGICFMS